MKNKLLLSIIVIFLLSFSLVSAISKYYSPIVTGQDITGEISIGSVYENLILGTPDVTQHLTTFNTCIFSGSGDSDYRYLNVDEDGLIYLTDDDFINIFDSDCSLIATHTINGTLMSQPFVFDVEGEGFQNIYYISSVGDISQINEYELVDGIIISSVPNQKNLNGLANSRCVGLYCDRDPPFTSGRCMTYCEGQASNVGRYIIFEPFDFNIVFNITSVSTGSGFANIYDESNDKFIIDGAASKSFDFFDRTYPAIYGMDIDSDDDLEVGMTLLCDSTNFDVCYTYIDLEDGTIIIDDVVLDTNIHGTNSIDFYSSGGFSQMANYGSLTSNGEIFIAYVSESDSGTSRKMFAKVYNSVGSEIKSVIDTTHTKFIKQISNFAVADIDRDLRNDYCIMMNETNRGNITSLYCYSGLTNNVMTNCTVNGWGTDNTIHLSLLEYDTISPRLNAITTFGIFDLSTNNGDDCINIKESGFNGLTSASEGALVPVDVSGDSQPDLIYYGADGARLFKTGEIAGQGTQTGLLCGSEHIIFCDDFNYEFGLIQRGWQILERNGEVNTTISPIDNRLNSTDIKFQSFVYDSSSVDVNYTISTVGEERRIVLSFVHPVVSHSFDLNIVDGNGLIEFRIDDRELQPSIRLRFENNNVSYFNESSPTLETVILEGMTPNTTHSIKVTQFFGNDNAKEQNEAYPFNISVDKGFYRVFIDNELIADNIFFTDNASFDFSTWLFTKNKETLTGFAMDNVFSYRGTSQSIDNTDNFFTPIVDDIVFECQVETLFCASTSECCNDLTCFNNKCTATSDPTVDDPDNNALRDAIQPLTDETNISLGTWWLIIMVAVGVVVFVGTGIITTKFGGQSLLLAFVVFLVTEFLLLIIGTRLGMLPVGIVITITVVALVIIGVFVTKWLTGTSSNG